MRLLFTVTALLIWVFSSAQKDSAFITSAGSAAGKETSAIIGSSGGILLSADGQLEIHFSAGALFSDTKISILPITNPFADNNIGAYRLEPSGIRFNKLVRLVFHYTGTADESEFKGIASQDQNGLWWQLRKTETDTVAKTISGNIPHFSDWQLFEKLVLKPKKASVKTNATLRLTVYEYSQDEDLLEELKSKNNSNYSQDADLLSPLVQTSYSVDAADLPPLTKTSDDELLQPLKPNYRISEWTVNGIVNGNSETGTIGSKMKRVADYKAPEKIPSENPVAVTAKVEGISYKSGKKKIRNLYLTSNVKITGDGYFVMFRGYSESQQIYSEDASSFLLTQTKEGLEISELVNHPVKHTIPPKAGGAPGCTITLHGLDTWTGPVQVGTVKQTFIRPATKENPFTRFDVIFANPPTALVPASTTVCKGITRSMPAFIMAGIPKAISFEVNGDQINIIWNEKRYGSYSKISDGNGWFEMSIKKM